jgi:hypothetical protein
MTTKLKRYKGIEIHPLSISNAMEKFGGYDNVDSKRLWQKVRVELNLPYSTSAGSRLR